jgi:2-hydroxy-3-keto-5-methylthiopentenyl-1-phosphate phosphatase
MSHSPRPVNPIIFCDFDGTITLRDVTDEILKRLARPGWLNFERMWAKGIIGSRECLERELALVTTTPSELDTLIDSIPIDPHFAGFLEFVRTRSIPFIVASDGLDYVIRRVLRRSGVRGQLQNGKDFFSSAVQLKDDGLCISFPHASADCTHGCATCKPVIIRSNRTRHWPVVYLGDGLSDRHAVAEADFVYARRPLLDECQRRFIPSCLFESFRGIEESLAAWLAGGPPVEMDRAARKRPEGPYKAQSLMPVRTHR